MPTPVEEFSEALRRHAPEFGIELPREAIDRLAEYYTLLLKWNPRLHLVAPCSPEEFAVRHVLESLLLLSYFPINARLADIGSGAGLPVIPCLVVREDLCATLIESSPKKAVFLNEALRMVNAADRSRLIVGRFEAQPPPPVDFVTCRALDRFGDKLPILIRWAPPRATLLLFAGQSIRKQAESLSLNIVAIEHIPTSERRFLIVASRKN